MLMNWKIGISDVFFLLGFAAVLAGDTSAVNGFVASEECPKRRGINAIISDPPLGASASEFAILAYDPSYFNELVYKYAIQAEVGETLDFSARGTGGSGDLVFDWVVFRSSDAVIEHRLQGAEFSFTPNQQDVYYVRCFAADSTGARDPIGDTRIVSTARTVQGDMSMARNSEDPMGVDFAVTNLVGLDESHVDVWEWIILKDDETVVVTGYGTTFSHLFFEPGIYAALLRLKLRDAFLFAYTNPGFSRFSTPFVVSDSGVAFARPFPTDFAFQVGNLINRPPREGPGKITFESPISSFSRVPFLGVAPTREVISRVGPYSLKELENKGGYQVSFLEPEDLRKQKFNESITIRSETLFQNDFDFSQTKSDVIPLRSGSFHNWNLDGTKYFALNYDGHARVSAYFYADGPFDLMLYFPGYQSYQYLASGVQGYTVQLGAGNPSGGYEIMMSPAGQSTGSAK